MRRIETMTDQEILTQSKETIELLRTRLKTLEETNEALKQHSVWLWERLELLYDRVFTLLEKEIKKE